MNKIDWKGEGPVNGHFSFYELSPEDRRKFLLALSTYASPSRTE